MNLHLSDAPCNELSVLRTEVKNYDRLMWAWLFVERGHLLSVTNFHRIGNARGIFLFIHNCGKMDCAPLLAQIQRNQSCRAQYPQNKISHLEG